jgi:HAT1-interacting factor 1
MARTTGPVRCTPSVRRTLPDAPRLADGAAAGAFFSFSGDAEEEDDDEEDHGDMPPPSEDVPVDLFAEANKAVEAEEAAERAEEEEQEDANDEPEDDFNAAWEILDLARSLFDKRKDEDDEVKLKLADTYVSLGDVSLETGALRQSPIHGLG